MGEATGGLSAADSSPSTTEWLETWSDAGHGRVGDETRVIGLLPMGVDVKTDSAVSSDTMVLASGVRATGRGVVSGGVEPRDVVVERVADQHGTALAWRAPKCTRCDQPVGIEASVFFRGEREPSSYRGL